MSENIWLEVSIYTTPEGIDPVFGMLLTMGIEGAEIVDEGDFNDFLQNYSQYWDYVDEEVVEQKKCPTHLKVYLRDDLEGRENLALLRENLASLLRLDLGVDLGSLKTELKNIDEDAWFENWKKYFKPLPIGKNVLVVPEWEKDVITTDKTILKINPGMLFGTGGHNTTKLCMEILEEIITESSNVFDIGCGSGILSILALLLGAKSATAIDIDSSAIKIAYENAALNGIGKDKYLVLSGNILENKNLVNSKYEIVVANIVADVIIPLSYGVRNFLAEGGLFICSGIIDSRIDDVSTSLLDNGFEIIEKRKDGDWWAIISK